MVNLTPAKFTSDGAFRPFAGNTVVANLSHHPQLMEMIKEVQSCFSDLSFCHKFTLTPPQSIHMTIIELLCDQNRQPEFWSKLLPIDLPIEAVHAYFGQQLSSFPLTHECIRMRVTGLERLKILLSPADEVSRKRLEAIRQYVSYQTGVLFPNHNSYQFHVTIGYLHQALTAQEQEFFDDCHAMNEDRLLEHLQELVIEQIDYTTFEDMTAFVPYEQ